jgi:hypothetical protein
MLAWCDAIASSQMWPSRGVNSSKTFLLHPLFFQFLSLLRTDSLR